MFFNLATRVTSKRWGLNRIWAPKNEMRFVWLAKSHNVSQVRYNWRMQERKIIWEPPGEFESLAPQPRINQIRLWMNRFVLSRGKNRLIEHHLMIFLGFTDNSWATERAPKPNLAWSFPFHRTCSIALPFTGLGSRRHFWWFFIGCVFSCFFFLPEILYFL